MFKVLLRLVFLVHQIIGQSDIEDDYAALFIKALQAGRVTRKNFSPQGSDISIIKWEAVYADIARFDAIVPYHPTAIAILAPVEKRLQNHSNCFNKLITYSHQFSNLGKLLEISGKTDISDNVFKIAINPHSMLVRNLKKVLKFIYSQKATKFFKISPLLLTALHTVKIKGKISQNFVAFSEYMHFKDMDRTFAG